MKWCRSDDAAAFEDGDLWSSADCREVYERVIELQRD